MAGALQLIARLQAAPVPSVPSRTEQHPIDTTSPAAPDRRSAWAVMRGGRPCCQLVGEPMTRAEALEAARWRWPDADIRGD